MQLFSTIMIRLLNLKFYKTFCEEDDFFFPISFKMIKLILYFYSKQIEQNDKLLRIKEPHFPDFL